jgi:hypothetical protein
MNQETWPDGWEGAVSLSFDDGTDNQLQRAVPMLNDRELKGTFYVPPKGDDFLERYAPWREVAATGHEIGNHTLSHTCSRNFQRGIRPQMGLEAMTLADVEADILEAERRLRELIPDHGPRTFCYPCYTTDVGEGATRQSYVPVTAKHFVAARAGGEYGFFNHPYNADLHHLMSTSGQQMTGPELIGLVELAMARGQWCILTFHGIDTGGLGVCTPAFAALLDHLARHRQRIWTDTVLHVAQHCQTLRERWQAQVD